MHYGFQGNEKEEEARKENTVVSNVALWNAGFH
jgi:hypothetical protein